MFFEFGLKDVVDIFLVATMLYYIYRLMRESRSLNVFIGIMVFVLVWLFVSQILEMRLLGSILDKLVSVGVIALIVLFQDDIRKFLYNLGAHQRVRKLMNLFSSKNDGKGKKQVKQIVMPVVMACMSMAKGKVGALIVIERASKLSDIVATGDVIDAAINQRLIENIFFKNSPLHDGAMIIIGDHIAAARCQLPMTSRTDIPAHYGMRHRAAIGLTEDTDADVLVVSEETGRISFVRGGEIQTIQDIKELRQLVGSLMTKEGE